MGTGSYIARTHRALAGVLGTGLVAVTLGAVAQPALAGTPHYSLAVVEGETTLPEYPVSNTSVRSPRGSEAVVSIVRNGTVVARSSGEGGAWLSQVPQVGDVLTLESPAGNLIASAQYDGLPQLAAAVCAGSQNFSGERTVNEEVSGGYFVATHNPYESSRAGEQSAQLTAEVGGAFAGDFLKPLLAGETVFANETTSSTLASGAIFTYSSENLRPVGGCPPPPPLPPPPPPPPALSGSIFKLINTTIRKLLRSGWSDEVIINQAGTVTQGLYMDSGKLPAYAASSKKRHHHSQPPALLLAQGTATSAGAGTVKVLLKATVRGRHKLKSEKKVKVVLITTLTTPGGQKLSLGRRTLTLRI